MCWALEMLICSHRAERPQRKPRYNYRWPFMWGPWKKCSLILQWRTGGEAPWGWELREGYTKEVVFGLRLNSKKPAKGTGPTEAEMSLACLRNRKVSVARSMEQREWRWWQWVCIGGPSRTGPACRLWLGSWLPSRAATSRWDFWMWSAPMKDPWGYGVGPDSGTRGCVTRVEQRSLQELSWWGHTQSSRCATRSTWIGKGTVGTTKQSEPLLLGEGSSGSIRFVWQEATSFRIVEKEPECKKTGYRAVR